MTDGEGGTPQGGPGVGETVPASQGPGGPPFDAGLLSSEVVDALLGRLWRTDPPGLAEPGFLWLLARGTRLPRSVRSSCLEGLGRIAADEGRFAEAILRYEQAEALRGDSPPERARRVDILHRLADVWASGLEAPEQAAAILARADSLGPPATPGLDLRRPENPYRPYNERVAGALRALRVARGSDARDEAEAALTIARGLGNPHLAVDALVLLAWAHAERGAPGEALAVCAEVEPLARRGSRWALVAELCLVRAWAARMAGDDERATLALEAATSLIEALGEGLPWEALQRSHASRLGPLLHAVSGGLAAADPPAAFRLAEWEAVLLSPVERAQPLDASVPTHPAARDSARQALATRPASVSPARLERDVRPPDEDDGVGVVFLRVVPRTRGVTVVWAATDGTAGAVDRLGRDDPRGRLTDWRHALQALRPATAAADGSSPAARFRTTAGRGLYGALVAPILARVSRPLSHLVVLQSADPDGGTLPFHALETEDGAALGGELLVSYAPSLAAYRAARERARRADGGTEVRGYFAVAPELGDDLEAGERRRAALAPLCAGPPVECRQAATLREALTARGALVFLGHGEARPELPALASLRTGDGALHAYELAALDVRTSLVVLAACWGMREGPLARDVGTGIVPSLLRGGAATIVAAGWPVREEVAEAFLAGFFGARPMAAPGAAYRAALDGIRARHADPHDWAAFFLCGAVDALGMTISGSAAVERRP